MPGDAARRAVEDALDGEPERVDSGRKEDDGTGLGLGESGGLSSVFVKRPAMLGVFVGERVCGRVADVRVGEVWYNGRRAGEAGLSSETRRQ